MQSSWVLARLDHETRSRHSAAEGDRLALMASPSVGDVYRRFLVRVFGFESPVEAAFHVTPGLGEVIDLRDRIGMKLLRSDLQVLGVRDPSQLPCGASVAPFRAATDALGWTYVLERNAILHGVLRRYLERVHAPLAKAGAYLAGNERATGSRMRELGRVLDTVAQTEQIADRIVDAANTAFRCQHHWFGKVVPLYGRVA